MGAAPQPRLLNRFPHRRLGVKVFEHSRFVSKHKKAVDFIFGSFIAEFVVREPPERAVQTRESTGGKHGYLKA